MSENLTVIKDFVLVMETRKAIRIRLKSGYCIWLPKSMIRNSTKNSITVNHGIYSSNLNKAIIDKREKEYNFIRSLNDNKMQAMQ